MDHDEVDEPGKAFEEHEALQLSDKQTRFWAMLLHFSVFLGYVLPIAGLIAPILIWQIKKDQLPGIDVHGKNVVNFLLSFLIYSVIALALCFILVGFLLLPVLAVAGIICPIIGGIKANDGEAWTYPMTIKFF